MAHIYALAGMAGVDHGLRHVHDYGVDGHFEQVIIYGNKRIMSGYPVAFQAKASTNWKLEEGYIVYDLDVKNFNDIVTRPPSAMTMILVLLCMPKEQENWHVATSDATILRNCCYWMTLTGEPSGNSSTMRIRIPIENLLTPNSLKELLSLEKERREAQWT